MQPPRTPSVEQARLAYRCRLVLPSGDGILISCLSTYVSYCHAWWPCSSSLTVCSSTSSAAVAFSKLPPLPMVSLTAHQLRYLAHFLRALRRPRPLRLPRQMAQAYVSSFET